MIDHHPQSISFLPFTPSSLIFEKRKIPGSLLFLSSCIPSFFFFLPFPFLSIPPAIYLLANHIRNNTTSLLLLCFLHLCVVSLFCEASETFPSSFLILILKLIYFSMKIILPSHLLHSTAHHSSLSV